MATPLPQRNYDYDDYYKRPFPPGPPKPPTKGLIKFFLLVILIWIIISIYKEYNSNKATNITSNTPAPINNINATNIIGSITNEPNRNGYVMSSEIKKIRLLFENLSPDDNIDELKNIVMNSNLSSEYNEYKNALCTKLDYYKEYVKNPQNDLVEKYNRINPCDELAKAFDKANVKYTKMEDGSINYWYSSSP